MQHYFYYLFWLCAFVPLRSVAQSDRAATLTAAQEYMDADSTATAARLFGRVIAGRGSAPIVDSLSGVAHHNLGVLAYYADDIPAAVDHFRRAVTVRDSVFPEPHNERAHSRSNLAYMFRLVDRLDSTAVRVREANALYARLPGVDTLNWLRSLNELGALALTLENYLMGYSSSYRAVALAESMTDLDPFDGFLTYYRAARILLRLERPGEALPLAVRAVALAEALAEPPLIADALNLLGIVQRGVGDPLASYRSLRAAEAQPLSEAEDALTMAFIAANLAQYYAASDDRAAFARSDRRARHLFASAEELEEYYQLDRLPAAYLRWEDYESALVHLDEGITALTGLAVDRLQADSIVAATPEVVPVIHLIDLRTQAYAGLGRHREALADYELLFRLQDKLREGVTDYASRSYHSRNLRPAFDRAIALYFAEYERTGTTADLWRAFRLSERARAYSLLATLRGGGQPTATEAALLGRIATLERERSLSGGDLQDSLLDARLHLERHYARAAATELPPPARVDTAALVTLLRTTGRTLLEYHLAPEFSLLFTLDPSGDLSAYRLDNAAPVAGLVDTFRRSLLGGKYRRKSLREPEEQRRLDGQYAATGNRLMRYLLPDSLRAHLLGEGFARLTLVPDGPLHYLPFAALPLAAAPQTTVLDYGRIDYLHRHAELSYAYSGATLVEVSRARRDTFRTGLLAFAPSFAPGDSRLAGQRATSREVLRSRAGLSALSYNEAEVNSLAKLFGEATIVTGEAATRSRFLASLGSARILHLSSHGMVDPLDPNLSFIAFAQRGALDPEELLYFNDLYRLPLDNELTVLSACETSLGQLASGETTLSMASAFTAAGARSTLTTLWQVDDEATKDIVVDFYGRLAAGQTRAAALHGAQQRLRAGDYAHPYYWAGLSLHGMTTTLPLLTDHGLLPWWGWAISAAVFLALMTYLLRFLHAQRVID